MDTPALFVTQAEYARMREVSRKSVTKWKAAGLVVIRASDGLVDVAASDAKRKERPDIYRGGAKKVPPELPAVPSEYLVDQPHGGALKRRVAALSDTPAPSLFPLLEGTPEDIAQAMTWSLADAQRAKEIYIALQRKREFDTDSGKYVELEIIAAQVEAEYGLVRERLLSVPGKIAAGLVGADRPSIESRLLDEITEALAELHDPGTDADAGGEVAPPLASGAAGV